MAISAEQLQAIMQQQQHQQQQQQFEVAQLKMAETMMQKFSLHLPAAESPGKQSSSVDAAAASITEFHHDPDFGVTFEAWFKRWEDIFHVEFAYTDDVWKVRLLLHKLGTKEHERYADIILPENPRDFTFDATVNRLSEIF
ncbi:unnamed protein product, partial [Dibothriocephalus latus]